MIWALPLATTELSPRSLTTVIPLSVFGVWLKSRTFVLYFSSSALPPRVTHGASRKTISERTSYYQIRLAFHSLPQLIRGCWTTHRFGPPFAFRRSSTWPRQAHLASGLYCTALQFQISQEFPVKFGIADALLTLGFPVPPPLTGLDGQCKISRWIILQ